MLVEDALEIAVRAHAGQQDKAGADYITHPVRVAAAVRGAGASAVVVALLHDVLEDTRVPLEELRARGLTGEEEEALLALTHKPHEQYRVYLGRVKAVPLARVIKAADIADNSGPARLGLLPEADQVRLRRKYDMALGLLDGRGGLEL